MASASRHLCGVRAESRSLVAGDVGQYGSHGPAGAVGDFQHDGVLSFWTQYASQEGMDLDRQSPDAVGESGGLTGEIVIKADQHLQLGQRPVAGVDLLQCMWHGSGCFGDHGGVAGIVAV